MLRAYFDESGLDNPDTRKLDWLVLGGAVARAEAWDALSIEWDAVLHDFGIKSFHMTDFEAYRKDFKDFSKPQHEALLSRLLDIQGKYINNIFGATNHAGRFRGKFRKIYNKNLVDILTIASQRLAKQPDEEMSIVFAAHKEISPLTVFGHFKEIPGNNKIITSASISDPTKCPPLQMADLCAYELSRSLRDGSNMRYPYKRMKETASVTLFLLMEARGGRGGSG